MTWISTLLVSVCLSAFHPFFVSVIEAEYFNKESTLGVSCKIYVDDLENTLKKSSGQSVDIINGNKTQNTQQINNYFSRHLRLRLDGKPIAYDLLGYQVDKDAAFVFLEVRKLSPPKKMEIDTDLLYDLDQNQINLVHWILNGKRQTQRLTYPKTSAIFE